MPILDRPRPKWTRIIVPRGHDFHAMGTVCMNISPCLLWFCFLPLFVCHSNLVCPPHPYLPQPLLPAMLPRASIGLSRRVWARVWSTRGSSEPSHWVSLTPGTSGQQVLGACLPTPTPTPLFPRLARTTHALCLPDPAESIPTILDGFHSQEVWAGHTMELPCTASGYPIPAIRWLKDGRPLPADSRWTKRITGLTISDLRTEDSGTYICEVTNTFGSAEVTGTLTVIGE